MIEVPGPDLARAGGEHADGPRDPLRQIEAHPRRADQDHQRHHQEQRKVDPLERSLQDLQLAVVFVGLRDAARVFGQIAGQ
jgi:hypothetical protein